MNAVIYARYSSDNQREESIEGQLRECTAFAAKNDITILRNYIDRAYSAKTDNRPAFQEMIKDSSKHLFDVIIVWKLDRFARNRYDSARYKTVLKKNGVKVVSATEAMADGAHSILMEAILEGFAEYYSADLAEKVVRGMTENAIKCKFNGGTIPTGYIIDDEQHFQPDPITAPFILEAYKLYDSGATMTEIRDFSNSKGLKNTRGGAFNFNSVQHMLKNRRYIGEYRYRDMVTPDGIPPIVPKELFDRVQEKMEKNKKAPAHHKAEDDYLLTTKLFCGYCGAYLCGESGTSHNGIIHHYYKCVNAKKTKTCKKKAVKKQWIEDLVVEEAMKLVMDDSAIEAIVSMIMRMQAEENRDLPLYEQQLQETKQAIQNLLNAIQQGMLTRSTKERLEALEQAQDELEIKIANEKISKPRLDPEFVTFWLHRFRKLDVSKKEHRKMLIDTFINAIFLYDDKLLLTFNYKEGSKTINFVDVTEHMKQENSSDLDCSLAPNANNPNLLPIGDWFGLFVFSDIYKDTHFRSGVKNGSSLNSVAEEMIDLVAISSTPMDNAVSAAEASTRNDYTFSPIMAAMKNSWVVSLYSHAKPPLYFFERSGNAFKTETMEDGAALCGLQNRSGVDRWGVAAAADVVDMITVLDGCFQKERFLFGVLCGGQRIIQRIAQDGNKIHIFHHGKAAPRRATA